jgi:predicted MFS family arabinose efflux permease
MPVSEESPAAPRPVAEITLAEWGLILILVAIQFTHMVDFVIIMPLGDRLKRELVLTDWQFAQIVSAYALAACVASLLASFVMDRFDRKKVLLAMYAGFTLSTLLCGLVGDYTWLLVSRALAGAFGGTAAGALMAVIGDVFPPDKRGRATGAVISSFAVASIVGLPIGLQLAEHFGRGAPFVVLAALSAVVWVLGWAKLPALRSHLTGARPNRWGEFAAVVRHPDHLAAFAFTFFLVLGTFTVASFIGPYLMSTNGWSEGQLSWIYFAAGICTLVGMTVMGRLSDRLPRLILFRVVGFAALVMAVVVTNLPPVPLWVAAVVISGFMVCAAGRMVPVQAILLGVAARKSRGGFMSLNTSIQHAATGVAPLIAGSLIVTGNAAVAAADPEATARMTGFPLVGWVSAGTAAVSLVLAGLLRPAREEVTAAVPVPAPAAEAVVDAA